MAEEEEEILENEEDSEEEDAGSKEEANSEEESSEEEEEGDDEGTAFFDASKVPEGLRPTFKKMQAAFTRKMQSFAKDVEMAEAFRELVNIPQFRLWANDMESGKGYGASSVYANLAGKKGAKDEDDSEEDDSGSVDGKLSMDKLIKAMTPVLREAIAQEVGPLKRQLREQSFSTFKSKTPDYDLYAPEITKLMKRHPTMTEEEAYDLVSGGRTKPSRKVNREALGKAKQARTEGGGAGKSGTESITPKTAKTVREALKMGLAAQGVSVD